MLYMRTMPACSYSFRKPQRLIVSQLPRDIFEIYARPQCTSNAANFVLHLSIPSHFLQPNFIEWDSKLLACKTRAPPV